MKNILKYVIPLVLVMTFFSWERVEASMSLCTSGSFKSYMPMSALSKRSAQYQYLQNYTYDRGDGLLVTKDGYIAVAMGPYYGKMGDKFKVTFANGQTTKVVKVDEKAHFVSGCHGMSSRDGSILEAILSGNPSKAYSAAKYHGNVGRAYKEFAAEHAITSILKVGGSTTNTSGSTTKPVTKKPITSPQVKKKEAIQLMIIYIPEEKHDSLLFVDTEFSGPERELIQAALIHFQRLNKEEPLYYFSSSLNIYKDTKVTVGFENYTNIKQGFLGNYGLKSEDFAARLKQFVSENKLNSCNTLLIGHGLPQDHELLLKEGCNLMLVDTYDTFQEAKRILEIKTGLSLESLAATSGYFTSMQHDAYQDAYALVPIFSHLKTSEFLQ